MNCRHCRSSLRHVFLDLGFAPPSNAYLRKADLERPERTYPLKLLVCECCWLVQTDDFSAAQDLFPSDYPYFSSTSSSWLEHALKYCSMIQGRLGLDNTSLVIEIGSNDGYLLRHFQNSGIPCLGIEPAAETARIAEKLGIPVLRSFFDSSLAKGLTATQRRADLIVGNNVFAHVPDVNDFTRGLRQILKPKGVISLEFPHLLSLIELVQFDTVYHEHFSYFSLFSVERIFEQAGLRVFDVEELPTHGGSLRVYGCREEAPWPAAGSFGRVLEKEQQKEVLALSTYLGFQDKVNRLKDDLLLFLIECKRQGKTVAGYGAAAKGNTLLNYAGVGPDLIPFVCDKAASKQGKYLPGSHIPVVSPETITQQKPDILLILPWNIQDEICRELSFIRSWRGRFARAIPWLQVW